MNNNAWIKIVEVGPRDGLQNEKMMIELADKIELIQRLSQAGLSYIESGSFVSPKWVAQMADTKEIFSHLSTLGPTEKTYSALVPNLQGLQSAVQNDVKEIAVFLSASATFSQANINQDISGALEISREVIQQAKMQHIKVRGYLSCVLGCPYEGKVQQSAVIDLTQKLLDFGVYEVSLGDTIGVGTPFQTRALLKSLKQEVDISRIAGHFHDTYGQALANVMVSIDEGVRVFDSAVSGLGGCPYAKGASGNLATEDLVYMLNHSGFETGVKLDKLIEASEFIDRILGRQSGSKVTRALSTQ